MSGFILLYKRTLRDIWFRKLSPDHKVTWYHLLLDADRAGILEIDIEEIERLSLVKAKIIKQAIAKFDTDGKIIQENGWLWIIRYQEYQRQNRKVRDSILSNELTDLKTRCPAIVNHALHRYYGGKLPEPSLYRIATVKLPYRDDTATIPQPYNDDNSDSGMIPPKPNQTKPNSKRREDNTPEVEPSGIELANQQLIPLAERLIKLVRETEEHHGIKTFTENDPAKASNTLRMILKEGKTEADIEALAQWAFVNATGKDMAFNLDTFTTIHNWRKEWQDGKAYRVIMKKMERHQQSLPLIEGPDYTGRVGKDVPLR